MNNEEIFNLASKLISFNSFSPSQAGCLDFIESYLKNLKFKTVRLDKNDTSNLIAFIGNKNKPLFAFAGHVDIVPTGDFKKWICNPFQLTKKNEKLIGRGISDMKGAIASFLVATKKFINTFPIENYNIAILLTSDEEGDAIDGTKEIVHYLKNNNIKIKYCILGEPSSENSLGDTIKNGRRGSISADIDIHGKQGHIAYPDNCINPIHKFAPILNKLIQLEWDKGNDVFPPTSLQFANINSGLGVDNVVPGQLFASLNIRYNNLHTSETIKKQIIDILNEYNVNYLISWKDNAKPFVTKKGALIDNLIHSINEQANLKPLLKTDGGTSDGRFLIDVCDELVEFGHINKSIHQINEFIKIDDLEKLMNIYYQVLNKIFNEQ